MMSRHRRLNIPYRLIAMMLKPITDLKGLLVLRGNRSYARQLVVAGAER